MNSFTLVFFIFFGIAKCQADATVLLNNKDANIPILPSQLRWATGDIYVQILGTSGYAFTPVCRITTGESVFKVDKNGFFDAGVGIIPGVPGGSQVDLKIRAWYGPGSFYASCLNGESVVWTQTCGSWDKTVGISATGSILKIPSSITFRDPSVPDVKSIMLGRVSGNFLSDTNANGKTYKITINSTSNRIK